MPSVKARARRAIVGAASVVALVVGLAACGSSNSSSSTTSGGSSTTSGPTTTLNQAAATTEITSNWQTYFNGANKDYAARQALMQDASKYKSLWLSLNGNSAAGNTAASVKSVTFPDSATCQSTVQTSTCAKVSYDLVNTQTQQPLLAGQTGYAVYVNGKWVVAANTFCALAALGGQQCPA